MFKVSKVNFIIEINYAKAIVLFTVLFVVAKRYKLF